MNILTKYTLKNLIKNRSRTIVTIVGIILSLSMMTSVTVLISSSQEYLINSAKASYGNWQGIVQQTDPLTAAGVMSDERVQDYFTTESVGYAQLSGGRNYYKPYVYIGSVTHRFFEKMPVHLMSGRLPQTNTEIILPEHIEYNGGVKFTLGQTVTFDVGNRVVKDEALGDKTLWQYDELDQREEFAPCQQLTYTVVGFYERPGFEDWTAPGYTALTIQGVPGNYPVNVYFSAYNPADAYSITRDYTGKGAHCTVNHTLMRFISDSRDNGFNGVLYGIGSVLMAIIVFASISLIYNAFSISVSERTKAFGLLSSLGATRRQIFSSVITEAMILCVIGVPLGVIAGLVGIGYTLHITQSLFRIGFEELVFLGADNVYFSMKVSARSVIIPAAVGVVTVLVSARIPALKAVKVSAIDAIRQTKEIHIETKDVKIPRFAERLFSVEGVISARNFRRSRRRYRATTVSLFISIVLFIAAYSFSDGLNTTVKEAIANTDYDLSYYYMPEENQPSMEEVYTRLKNLNGVYKSGYQSVNMDNAGAARRCVNPAAAASALNRDAADGETVYFTVNIIFVDDENYDRWLAQNGYSTDRYRSGIPVAYTTNCMELYDSEESRFYNINVLKQNPVTVSLYSAGTQLYIADFCDNMPYGTSHSKTQMPLIVPYSMLYEVVPGYAPYSPHSTMTFSVEDPYATETKMYSTLGGGPSAAYIYNSYQQYQRNSAIINIIKVFTYGFTVLIGLISTANVFNTISTNISLRRREFAVLRSMGMTAGGLRRMMAYECIMYGAKAILLGVPVGILISLRIQQIINTGYAVAYVLPVKGILISVSVVMAVVFITMSYAGRRVSRENTIDALKNENL